MNFDNDPVVIKIKEAANKIKHCGNYGIVLWCPDLKRLHVVMGDGDGVEPYTDITEIERMMKEAGALEVEVAGEEFPDEDFFSENDQEYEAYLFARQYEEEQFEAGNVEELVERGPVYFCLNNITGITPDNNEELRIQLEGE